MTEPRRLRAYASDTPEYQRAFKAFLDNTDQKENALAWLTRQVNALPSRQTLIDAGAGTGKLTAALLPSFDRVVAIEPNPSLQADLRAACPTAAVLPATILDARPDTTADFILCSHVFYYIPRSQWGPSLRRLVDWLRPGATLAITIQNPGTDCMQMLDHFFGQRFDLNDLRAEARLMQTPPLQISLETVDAHIRTSDLPTACTIAEFMLNLLPMPSPPSWPDVEQYVDSHFRLPGGGYRMSCHQDFLRIVRPSPA
jgi:SAM-dependent methyltransferase